MQGPQARKDASASQVSATRRGILDAEQATIHADPTRRLLRAGG